MRDITRGASVPRLLWTVALLWQITAGQGVADMNGEPVEHLGDLLGERLLLHTQAWGLLGVDTATHAQGRTPHRLRIGDITYERGLGTHATGDIVLMLDGEYATFEAQVGVLWQDGGVGSVVFQVYVDDEKRFDSGVMRETDAAMPIRVDVAGAQLLRLTVTDAGDGITCDCANWAEARLTRADRAVQARQMRLDMAPFATVATWDPERMDGARAGRVQEFAPEDVYLHTELVPNADGVYEVPAGTGGGCIGLQWVERRLLKELEIEFVSTPPDPQDLVLQRWVGESWWQGEWRPAAAELQIEGERWRYTLSWAGTPAEQPKTSQKIRWVFSGSASPPKVRSMAAYTRSVWATTDLRLESEGLGAEDPVTVGIYNGAFVAADSATSLTPLQWAASAPPAVQVAYSRGMPLKSDRTVLRCRVPRRDGSGELTFAVAIEDVLKSGCVWVPAAGLYVTTADNPQTLAGHRQTLEGQRTIRERVAEMPDQTFASAMERVHNPVQDLGPMLVSLACDNHKFQVQRDGAIQFSTRPDDPRSGVVDYPVELRPQFAGGEATGLSRRLYGDWLPVPEITLAHGAVTYRQRTYVVSLDETADPALPRWLSRRPACVADFTIHNTGQVPADASLRLDVAADRTEGRAATLQAVEGGVSASDAGRLLVFIDTGGTAGLVPATDAGAITLSGELPAGASATIRAWLPAWELGPTDSAPLRTNADLQARVESYWKSLLAEGAEVELPDPLLQSIIQASRVHCLLAARSEGDGARISPWIGSDRYGPLESEANSIVLGMDYLGHEEFSRRSLDFFVGRYNPAGYLTTGYTLMGTGWHLWTLAEHVRLTGDEAWLGELAPKVAGLCEWIAAQREKTRRLRPDGEKQTNYGLMPPGVVADWGMYANRFYMDGHFCAGLLEASEALSRVGHPEASRLQAVAAEYRAELSRAYQWTQANTPVRQRLDGTWAPGAPGMTYCFGTVGEFFPGEDWGRTWAGDVEIGPHHLAALGLMEAGDAAVDWMMDELEDIWCLHSGLGDYPGEKSQQDWFTLGGFAKVQPYYARMCDVYARRDEVRSFIRSYFNAIPSLVSLENLSFWEHFHNIGGWNKTHETGAFLQQTRRMLVDERGSELWLAPFVTSEWLKDGLQVSLKRAPTRFGPVSYRIRSSAAQGTIEAEIDPPTRTAPAAIVLRLRHPEGRPMRRVMVNDEEWDQFDPQSETIRLQAGAEPLRVKAEF